MKTAFVGLLAVPVVLALLTSCSCVQACVGGESGKTYMDQNMTVPAGQYTAKDFTVSKVNESVSIGSVQGVRMYLLADNEMSNFSAGKNFTSIYNSSKMGTYGGHALLAKGKYWVVLDNRASTTQASTDVLVYKPGSKCGATGPLPVPGYEGGMVVLALIGALALCLRKGLGRE